MTARSRPRSSEANEPIVGESIGDGVIRFNSSDYDDLMDEFSDRDEFQKMSVRNESDNQSIWTGSGMVFETYKEGDEAYVRATSIERTADPEQVDGKKTRNASAQDVSVEEFSSTIDTFVNDVVTQIDDVAKGGHDSETGEPTAVWRDQAAKNTFVDSLAHEYANSAGIDYASIQGVEEEEFDGFVADFDVETSYSGDTVQVFGEEVNQVITEYQNQRSTYPGPTKGAVREPVVDEETESKFMTMP